MATSVQPQPASPPPAAPPSTPIPSAEELAAKVSRLIIKNNGDAAEAIQAVLDDNKNLRDHKRHWEAENTRLKAQVDQMPKDGVMLTAAEKPLWEKLKELQITKVEDLVTMHTEHGAFKAKAATDATLALFAEMATGKDDKGQDIGYDPKLLGELLNLKGMVGEMKDAIVPDPNDKTKTISIKIPYVKPKANPNAAAEPLTQYVARELSGFQDALRKAAAPADGKQSRPSGRTGPREVPPQQSTTTSSATTTPGGQGADGIKGAAQRVLGARYGDPLAKPGDKATT